MLLNYVKLEERKELYKLVSKVKISGLTKTNSDIFIVSKP